MKKKQVWIRVLKGIFYAAVLITAGYIMMNGLGLVDSLDFGAGAYYYADMPGFANLVNPEHFQTKFPMWVFLVLFFVWGGLMYKLWTWLDKKWTQP